MNQHHRKNPVALPALLVVLALLGLLTVGCGKDPISKIIIPNQAPNVTLTSAPIDTNAVCNPGPTSRCYSITLDWSGYDPDGRVDHYLYAIDPPHGAGADTVWNQTRQTDTTFVFQTDGRDPNRPSVARKYHVFVIKAVDDRDLAGPPVFRAFFSYTLAPSVRIITPPADHLFTLLLAPSVRFVWIGDDPDGVQTQKPVQYKYLLVTPSPDYPPGVDAAIDDPQALLDYYAPEFPEAAGWRSTPKVIVPGTPAETTFATFTNLPPGDDRYAFFVVAIDEAGAYSPIANTDTNVLKFRVGSAERSGPIITLFNESFNFTYLDGGVYNPTPPPSGYVIIEQPALTRFTINWDATPPAGATIAYFRWSVDNPDVRDNTARQDDQGNPAENDPSQFYRWSQPSRNVKSVTLGPYPGTETHRLYVEAVDSNGQKSLGIVEYNVVLATLERNLLIVDDTRFRYDQILPGTNPPCTDRPQGIWPTASEADSFLYAVGGVQYQCYEPGTLSEPGVFSGYHMGDRADDPTGAAGYDTIGTSIKRVDLTVRLAVLGRYRHLIWLTDALGARNSLSGLDAQRPQTALRYMSGRGRVNTIGAYVRQGGHVWMAGGGVALASLIFPWNNTNNDRPTTTFNGPTLHELVPGRMMYDLAMWQSELRCAAVGTTPQRFTGRFEPSGGVYATLPPRLEAKSEPPADPLPPYRTEPQFYQSDVDFEFIQLPNDIVEDIDPSPAREDRHSVLDTLYRVPDIQPPTIEQRPEDFSAATMTFYHGVAHQDFIFTGFGLWSFKKESARRLVNFVLTELWHFPAPRPSMRRAHRSSIAAADLTAPSTRRVLAPQSRRLGLVGGRELLPSEPPGRIRPSRLQP